MIGKQFGAYKIESKIGAGGMGVVYKARDLELDRPVAIKMVLDASTPEGTASDEAIARFLREAKAASRLQHPAIVHIYQFGVEDKTRYLAMEFIEGQNLRALINRRPLPVEKICEITAQVADGLAMAHEMGVVHRDLKVENIMVTSRGQAKILDFGLAKVTEHASGDDATMDDNYFATQLGTVLGTASSMAPEQALGREIDSKADIFSLGVVMYEMATGMNPFLAKTAQQTLAKIMNHQPELVSLVNPSIPPELERLIHLCLRKDPKQRPTAAEVTNICKRLSATANLWTSGASAPAPSAPAVAQASSPSTPPAALASLLRQPSSKVNPAAPAPASKGTVRSLAAAYRVAKMFRIAVSWITMVICLTYFFYMLIGAQIIRAELVQGTRIWGWIQALVVPSLALGEKIFAFNTVVGGWNLLLAGMGVAALLLRYVLLMPIEHMEFAAKTNYVKAKGSVSSSEVAHAVQRNADDRLTLLRQYSAGQRAPAGTARVAILSVDIVGWARMTAQEDPLVAEHAFAEYKKFVDRILRSNGALKNAFSDAGIVSALPNADSAVTAAKAILCDLDWFNDGIHRLSSEFHVRCGINVGEVKIDKDKPLEEVNSEVIDIATKMQKSATADSLRLTGDVLALVSDSAGFDIAQGQEFDGRVIYQWRPAADSSSAKGESA